MTTAAARAHADTGTPLAVLRRHVADATRELDALRLALDAKLAALETALKNPGGPEENVSLENLVIELARVATAEAEAAAARACLDAKLAAQQDTAAQVGAVRAEAERAVKAERAAASALRGQLDEQHAVLDAECERTATLRRDVEELRGALEGERSTSTGLRGALEGEHSTSAGLRGALEDERSTTAGLRQNLEEASQRITAVERAMEAELAGMREQHGHALASQRAEAAELGRAIEALQGELDDTREEARGAARAAADERVAEMDASRLRLEATDARLAAAERQVTDIEGRRLEALARAQAAIGERDILAAQLQASHDAADERIAVFETAQQHLEAAAREITDAEIKRQEALERAEAAVRDRDALAAERAEIERALHETEKCLDTTTRDRDGVKADRDTINAARDAISAQRDAINVERDALKADLEAARDAAREAVARAAEAEAQRDEAVEAAARSAAQLAAQPPASAPTVAPSPAPPADSTAEMAEAEGPLYPNQPARRACRHMLADEMQVEVDAGPAVLVDLSATGAQLLSPTALKPNRVVKLLLPGAILCKGKVVWARLEPACKGHPLAYRAGVCFTSVDEAAVEGFLASAVNSTR